MGWPPGGAEINILTWGALLQLTASPWTTEVITGERWQFGALTNRKATTSNRAPSTSSLYYYQVALSLYWDKRITIIRLWWLSQWLVTHGHHLAVNIYLHVAPSPGRHSTEINFRGCWGRTHMWRQKVKGIRLSLLHPYSNQVLGNGRGVELLRHGQKGCEVEKG